QTVEVFGVIEIAPVMDERADLLQLLTSAQSASDAAGQKSMSAISRVTLFGCSPPQAQQRLDEALGIKARRCQQGMERHRQTRCRCCKPAETTVDVDCALTESAVFELQIDGIEAGDFFADVLDVFVSQFADTAMRAAQQVLVEVERGYVECLAELPAERRGIRGHPAQLAAG